MRAGINAVEGHPVEAQTVLDGAADEREHLTQIQGAADETADGLQPLQVEQLACRVSGVPSENRRIHDGLILVALRPGLPGRAARCLGDAARSWLAFNCNCQTAAAVEEGD